MGSPLSRPGCAWCFTTTDRRIPARREGSYFCTDRCAANYGENVMQGSGELWHETYGIWSPFASPDHPIEDRCY